MKPITFPMLEKLEHVTDIRDVLQTKDRVTNMKWALQQLTPLLQMVQLSEQVNMIITTLQSYDANPISVHHGRLYALEIHKYARESQDFLTLFTLRALGHTTASLHVHTHAYGMVLYSLKAYHQMGYTNSELQDVVYNYKKKLE